jgi:Predicted membrane protein
MKYTRLAGYSVFVGAAQFLILMIVAEAIYPGYSVSQNYISDLGNPRLAPSTPHATIFNTSIILLGLLLIIGGSILAYKERGVTGRLLGVLVAISGLGAAGVGFFPEGSPYDLHVISSLIVFLFASLASYPASLYRGHRSPLWGALGTIGPSGAAPIHSQRLHGPRLGRHGEDDSLPQPYVGPRVLRVSHDGLTLEAHHIKPASRRGRT